MPHVLVTGGAGFIGRRVAEALLEAGYGVSVLDLLHPAAHGVRPAGLAPTAIGSAPVHIADVRDAQAVAVALRGVDVVVHQAAMVGMGVDLADLPEYVGCNDLGTAVLLSQMAAAGLSRLVLASSMVVYGEGAYSCPSHGRVAPPDRTPEALAAGGFEPHCPRCDANLRPELVQEDDRLEPRSVYAATKLAQEQLCVAWARQLGGRVVALRYHNVYGPGMPRDTPYSGVAAIFRSALEAGRSPRVFEDGAQRRDFIHVDDVARANVAAVDALFAGTVATGMRPYNVASGRPATIAEMATALCDAFGGPAPVVTGQFRMGDVRHIVAAPNRAAEELGFVASVEMASGMLEFAKAELRG
jgi:dTDP-L-rhamnose 4-epimerase